MKIDKIFVGNSSTLCKKYALNKETIKLVEQNTKLTYDEMRFLPFNEITKLINQRKIIKEANKIKLWFINKLEKIKSLA